MKKPARLVGERVGEFGSDCDGQPIPPRIRVVMVMNIMVAGRRSSSMSKGQDISISSLSARAPYFIGWFMGRYAY